MKVAIIIVTKDRPTDLQRCLQSVVLQTILPDQVIIVDASVTPQPLLKLNLPLEYYSCSPGITKQRNVARTKVADDTDIVMYLDDDTELAPDTIQKVIVTFQEHSEVIGVTGSIIGEAKAGWLKTLFGYITFLYSSTPYTLTPGLFNIITPALSEQSIQWLPGAFMCYRWSIVKDLEFDEWFSEYGLAEDFDFSWRAKLLETLHETSLVVNPAIQVQHHHSSVGRNWKKFGYMRIVNRNYLRQKFFPKQCKWWVGMWWANGWLLVFNTVRGVYSRRYREELIGNIQGIIQLVLQRLRLR